MANPKCSKKDYPGHINKRKFDSSDEIATENKQARSEEPSHFEQLPPEIVVYLCKRFLSMRDAFNLSEVNQHFSFLKYDSVIRSIVEHKEDEQRSKEHFEWIELAMKELQKQTKSKKVPSFRYKALASLLALRWATGKPVRHLVVTYEHQCLWINPTRAFVNDDYVIFEYPNVFEKSNGKTKHLVAASKLENKSGGSTTPKECMCLAKCDTSFTSAYQVWKLDVDEITFYTCNNNMSRLSCPPKPKLYCNQRISDTEFGAFGFEGKCTPLKFSKWQPFGSPLPKKVKQLTLLDTSTNGIFRIGSSAYRENLKDFNLETLIYGDVVQIELVAHYIVCQILYTSSGCSPKEGLAIININKPPNGPEGVEIFGILPALSNGTARNMVVGLKRILRFNKEDVRCIQVDSFL